MILVTSITIMPFYKSLNSFVFGSTCMIGPIAWDILPVVLSGVSTVLFPNGNKTFCFQLENALSLIKLILIATFTPILIQPCTPEVEVAFWASY